MFVLNKIIEYLNFNSIDPSFFFLSFLTVLMGFTLRQSLVFSGQAWAKTYSNTLTYILLPFVGLVITQVISGNISLSLGMVGALSIIRFRHPVKSPLELTVYFLLLTLGISSSVSPIKAIYLCGISCLTIYIFSYYRTIKFRGKSSIFSILDLPAENSYFLLDIYASNRIESLSENNKLLFSNENKEENRYTYKLKFSNILEANEFKNKYIDDPTIIEIKSTYS
tara:strand:+ start:299 stop:970 length:672 start_codon:yes stop_codon:yes gene_type:complete